MQAGKKRWDQAQVQRRMQLGYKRLDKSGEQMTEFMGNVKGALPPFLEYGILK
jgi:hypothetical protein